MWLSIYGCGRRCRFLIFIYISLFGLNYILKSSLCTLIQLPLLLLDCGVLYFYYAYNIRIEKIWDLFLILARLHCLCPVKLETLWMYTTRLITSEDCQPASNIAVEWHRPLSHLRHRIVTLHMLRLFPLNLANIIYFRERSYSSSSRRKRWI